MKRCRRGSGTKFVKGGITVLAAGAALVASMAMPHAAGAQAVQLTPFGGQTYTSPYHVAAPPGDPGRVFVVEGPGTIRLVKGGATQPQPFLSVGDVRFGGGCSECGLLSMAFAPDYAASGLFYVFYTRDDPTPGNEHFLVIREYRRSAADPDLADPASARDVLTIEHFDATNHNGGQLQFGPDGMLYIATGDGAAQPIQAQDETTLLGKILRIDPRGAVPGQYSIPPGNPLTDGPGGNADEIFVFGLRNPYRFSFDRSTGDLTIGDVGGGQLEEVDFKVEGTAAGSNFGWPCFEGTLPGPIACTPNSHSPPALQYSRLPMGAAAINGGFVIRDPALPAHAGRYLFADTYAAVDGLRTAQLSASGLATHTKLGDGTPAPVSFGQDACGHLYVASFTGPVSRIDPAGGPSALCKLAPVVTLDASPSAAAGTTGALVAGVACDEDCTATVRGSIAVEVPGTAKKKTKKAKKRKKQARAAKKKNKKGKKRRRRATPPQSFTIQPQAVTTRVQLGGPVQIRLELTGADRTRLTSALRSGGSASASLDVTATGGGGGSADASGTAAVTKPAAAKADKKKKKKRKKKRKKRRGR